VHASELDAKDSEAHSFWQRIDGIFDNETTRWLDGVERAEARLQKVRQVIHLYDRAADCFEHIFCMVAAGYEFIGRATYDRRIYEGEDLTSFEKISDALERAPWLGKRTISLAARKTTKAPKQYPLRKARDAKVRVRTAQVILKRPDNVEDFELNEYVTVNVVEVLETHPPKGAEPVRWLLYTDQPCENEEEVWQVVDGYRARWLTEEFYKALKTGAAYTKLQHRSAHTLLNALALKSIVAWQLLMVRHLGQNAPNMPGLTVANELQIKILRDIDARHVPDDPTAHDIMLAIAFLGGHFSHNGPPGWLVLGRGWEKLTHYEEGARMALRLADKDKTCGQS
jgi:hypothetical protein